MKRVLLTATGVAIVLSFTALPARAYETKVFPNTDGLRIHDVAPAPDGLVWWTARGSGQLGILDPSTGESRFVELGPDSAPHGVIQGPDGLAWITDSGQNAIVSYDPSNQDVAVYPLPEDTGFTNLNTPAIDGDGNVWFTGQNGIYGKVTVDILGVSSAASGCGQTVKDVAQKNNVLKVDRTVAVDVALAKAREGFCTACHFCIGRIRFS